MKSENKFEEVISRAKIALKVTTDGELAALLEMKGTAFSNRRKKESIPYEKLAEVLESHKVDLGWVFTGNVGGSTLRDASLAAAEAALRYTPVSKRLIQEMQEVAFTEHLDSDQLAQRFSDRLPKTISVDEDVSELNAAFFAMNDYQLVPRSTARPTGGSNGLMIQSEQIVNYLAFERDWLRRVLNIHHPDIALVEIRGYSMAETLVEGDLVLVDLRQNRLDVSAVFVIEVKGSLLVKRVQRKMNGNVVISSDNKEFEPEEFADDELTNFRIMGRVVWPRLR